MAEPAGRGKGFDRGWLAAVLVLSSAWVLTAAGRTGPTYDEPFYMIAGLEGWRTFSAGPLTALGTMPLPTDVHTLPVFVWESVVGVPFAPLEDMPRILPVARAANLPFWWLLIIAARGLAAHFGGPVAGRLACGLTAADPNLLGHASLATTDVPFTAVLLAFAWAVVAGRGRGVGRRVGVPGGLFGLALLAKASAVLFGPVVLLTFMVRGGKSFRDAVVIGVLGVGIAVAYCGAAAGPAAKACNYLPADDPAVRILRSWADRGERVPNAAVAVLFQTARTRQGSNGFVFGEMPARPTWYYFPACLAVKTPLPPLIFGLGLLVLRPRAFANAVTLAAVLLLLAAITGRVQLGVRLVFPVLAMGYVAVAVAAARGGAGRVAMGVVFVGIAVAGWAWPNGLTFANRAFGGPNAVHRHLGDSNADWGQGLPALRKWHAAAGEPATAVWYFGTDPAVHRSPFRPFAFEQLPITTEAELLAVVGPAMFAVSTNHLTTDPDATPAKRVVVGWVRRQIPVARTPTFLIFDARFSR